MTISFSSLSPPMPIPFPFLALGAFGIHFFRARSDVFGILDQHKRQLSDLTQRRHI